MTSIKLLAGIILFLIGLFFIIFNQTTIAPFPAIQVGVTFFCTGIIIMLANTNKTEL